MSKKIYVYSILVSLFMVSGQMASAHDSDITIDRVGGVDVIPGQPTPLVVPYLPFTLIIEGTVTHTGEGNLNILEFWATDNGEYIYDPTRLFKGFGKITTAPYVLPWRITEGGIHVLSIDATHTGGEHDEIRGCRAAPAIANTYLKAEEIGKKSGGTNIISDVAKETGKNGTLWAKDSCDIEYETNVVLFVEELIE